MTQCTATFETGVNGATVATGDTGSATAFDGVRITATTGRVTYDTTHVADGTLAMKIGNSGGNGSGDIAWSTAMGTVTDSYGRAYMYMTAYESGQTPFIQYTLAAARAARIDITAGGVLAGFDSPAGALFPTFSTQIALNQWVRIEWHIVHSATVGQCEVKLFNTATSSTPTETQTGTANKNTLVGADRFAIGPGVDATGSLTSGNSWWFDNIVAGATSYPGPFAAAPANTVAPVASGTATVGQTLSATDGTWTGTPTPTFTYQWKRDGVSIGGQTASSHTIVSADQGTTLTCTVTGTNTAGNASATSNGIAIAAAASSTGPIVNPGLAGYLDYTGRV